MKTWSHKKANARNRNTLALILSVKMSQDLASAIVAASYTMDHGAPRAWAALNVNEMDGGYIMYNIQVPDMSRPTRPDNYGNHRKSSLVSALNTLALAGFYPDVEQKKRLEEFMSHPVGEAKRRLYLIFHKHAAPQK